MSVVGTISRTNEAEHMESSTKPSSLILPAPKLTAPVLAPTVKQREANIEQPKKNIGRPKGSKTVNKTKAVKDSDIRNPVAEDASSEDRLETNFVSPHSHLPNKRRRPNSAATAHMAIRCSTSELEDWELGVGRVINIVASNANSDISDEEEDDIAFSASYLDKHDSGITFGSVNFTIMRLRGGASQNWESANSILYICSVASGKVNVKIDGKDFTIGANGIWRVRQGEQCTVTNRFYGEAVIHVCTTRQ
jgi:large exoprotein involved in heme utilization and adhesion